MNSQRVDKAAPCVSWQCSVHSHAWYPVNRESMAQASHKQLTTDCCKRWVDCRSSLLTPQSYYSPDRPSDGQLPVESLPQMSTSTMLPGTPHWDGSKILTTPFLISRFCPCPYQSLSSLSQKAYMMQPSSCQDHTWENKISNLHFSFCP